MRSVERNGSGRRVSFGRGRGAATASAAVLGFALAGCAGISDCNEDGPKCAEMLNGSAEKCAMAFQLAQGENKRKFCESAIKTVGKNRTAAALPALGKILAVPESSAPSDAHRQEAARAIGEIGDKSGVDTLMTAIDFNAGSSGDAKDKNTNRTNEVIAESLARLGDPKACGKLAELMQKTHADYAQLKALRALGSLHCKDAIAALSDIALKHDNKFMRKNAVIALGDIGDPAATATLVQMLFIEYQGVSFYPEASFALFQIGPSVADALLETMDGKNADVNKYFETSGGMKTTATKAKCGFILSDLRDPRAVKPLSDAFQGAVKTPDPVVLAYSATALGALGDRSVVPMIKAQMMTLDASQREPLMRALNQLGDRSVVPQMIEAMSADNFVNSCVKQGLATKEECAADRPSLTAAQKVAADSASNLASEEHLAAFKAAVEKEANPDMKDYFAKRLVRVEAAAECKADGACWAKKLKAEDPLLREKAAWELGRIKDPSTIPALAEALGDQSTFVRSAAIAAYWTYGDKSAVPAIEKRLAEEEGSATFIRVKEDMKRMLVYLKRKA